MLIKSKNNNHNINSIKLQLTYTMSHYTATITHSKNQPIGIGLSNDPVKGIVITSIDSTGPLGDSCLRKGMVLRTINNIDVSNRTSKEAVKMLKEAEPKLIISAENVVPPEITFTVDKHYRREDGVIVNGMMKDDINNATPTVFNEAGVPPKTFSRIYKLIESDLLPHAAALRVHEKALEREFGSYVGTQMVTGGMIGFGTESRHEKMMYEMIMKSSHLERNVDLKAVKVVAQVNAMLAKYNIMASIALEPRLNGNQSNKARNKYEKFNVVGLEFDLIE